MGAYFSLETDRRLPLLDPVATGTCDPKTTLQAGKLTARAFASLFEGTQREAVARSFVRALVETYWSHIQKRASPAISLPATFLSERGVDLAGTVRALAKAMGEAASALEPLAAAYLVSVTYTAMLPDCTRSKLGAYYTPPPLTERLVSMATRAGINWSTCRVLDPACGGGAFLCATASSILRVTPFKSPEKALREIAARLRGFEIDPFAAWLSQVFLEATVLPLCQRAGRRLPVLVTACDSLAIKQPRKRADGYDLVIGNPPYGRVSLSTGMRNRYSRSLYGHANLYGLFTDLAIRFARPGGVVAYVTPTSFLAGEYFKSLRSLLATSARLVNIDFVSVRKGVFDDVLQETMLATYRKAGLRVRAPTVHFVAPTNQDDLTVQQGGTFDLPTGAGPWLVPRALEQVRLIEKLRSMPHRLKDYGYEVSTGPLVWNRHKPQLCEEPGRCAYPLIWAEAITSEGRFQFRANKRNHSPYFKIREGDDWLVTREPCVLLQRTTAKEQTRRLIAAELPEVFIRKHGAVVVENHLNMIRPTTETPAVPATILAALLNSTIVDRAFRCISGSVAVSAYELESLPLPPPTDLKGLLGRAADTSAVDQACFRLYS